MRANYAKQKKEGTMPTAAFFHDVVMSFALGSNLPTCWESKHERQVVAACNAGACRFVPLEGDGRVHLFRDTNWNIECGLVLTSRGEEYIRRMLNGIILA